jgi:hypothetical protein
MLLLRHGPSGFVLTAGDAEPVRFADQASADAFGRRFLDEVEAWETVHPDDVRKAA